MDQETMASAMSGASKVKRMILVSSLRYRPGVGAGFEIDAYFPLSIRPHVWPRHVDDVPRALVARAPALDAEAGPPQSTLKARDRLLGPYGQAAVGAQRRARPRQSFVAE